MLPQAVLCFLEAMSLRHGVPRSEVKDKNIFFKNEDRMVIFSTAHEKNRLISALTSANGCSATGGFVCILLVISSEIETAIYATFWTRI